MSRRLVRCRVGDGKVSVGLRSVHDVAARCQGRFCSLLACVSGEWACV